MMVAPTCHVDLVPLASRAIERGLLVDENASVGFWLVPECASDNALTVALADGSPGRTKESP